MNKEMERVTKAKCRVCGKDGGFSVGIYSTVLSNGRRASLFRCEPRPPWFREGPNGSREMAFPGGGYCRDHASAKAKRMNKGILDDD